MSVCPTCHREFEPEPKPLTTVAINVKARVAQGDIVLRTHIVDLIQEAILEWLHENSWDTVQPSDSMEDLIDIVIAR